MKGYLPLIILLALAVGIFFVGKSNGVRQTETV